MPALPALAVTRLRFTVVMDRALQWPAHAGALLRSVFGAALRQGVCSTGLPHCADCALLRSCAYPAIFETPPRPTQFAQRFSHVPNPYVIEPPPGGSSVRPGDPWVFHLVLVGEAAQRRLPLIVGAWQRALRSGLGQTRVTGRLAAVEVIDAAGHAVPAFDVARSRAVASLPPLDLSSLTLAGGGALAGVSLQFDAPLRLQHESRPLRPQELTPRIWMSHLLRRINLMLDLHLDIRPAPYDARALLACADDLADNRSRLQWHDLRRYSARQGQELPQGGVVGSWTWLGAIAPLLPWILLGQWLHVGKGATAGLGAYRVQPLTAGTLP
ncbi:MAG: CRISPR system precrRNA processing endoribonuclease RAMP protein Cas6 [Rubrivivax sp.]|nr:CRISPR system precrRNA processing endoribonuclease RAMP protein Cas6 [Rubrivivax sp.]